MAKLLKEQQPRSSFSRFLSPGLMEQVNAPSNETAELPPEPPLAKAIDVLRVPQRKVLPMPAVQSEKVSTRSRDFLLTQEQDSVVEELVSVFRMATGARPSASHIMRATLQVLKDHLPAIREEAQNLRALKRPSNSAGNGAEEWRDFENAIASVINRGLKS